MDETPFQPPDDLDILNDLLGRARYFILDLIGFLDTALERLGNIPLSARVVRYLTRRALLPAEAALRRAIILMVLQLEPAPAAPARAPAKASARPPAPPPQAAASPRAPLFRMSEPQPRPVKYPEANYLPEDLMPRITLLTDAVLRARPAAAPPPVPRDPAAASKRCAPPMRTPLRSPAAGAAGAPPRPPPPPEPCRPARFPARPDPSARMPSACCRNSPRPPAARPSSTHPENPSAHKSFPSASPPRDGG